MGIGYGRYWEMKTGGPYDDGTEMFKCKDCGAETFHEKGYDGEPDPHNCHGECKSRGTDWAPGRVSNLYRANFDRNFPDAPGGGM